MSLLSCSIEKEHVQLCSRKLKGHNGWSVSSAADASGGPKMPACLQLDLSNTWGLLLSFTSSPSFSADAAPLTQLRNISHCIQAAQAAQASQAPKPWSKAATALLHLYARRPLPEPEETDALKPTWIVQHGVFCGIALAKITVLSATPQTTQTSSPVHHHWAGCCGIDGAAVGRVKFKLDADADRLQRKN